MNIIQNIIDHIKFLFKNGYRVKIPRNPFKKYIEGIPFSDKMVLTSLVKQWLNDNHIFYYHLYENKEFVETENKIIHIHFTHTIEFLHLHQALLFKLWLE